MERAAEPDAVVYAFACACAPAQSQGDKQERRGGLLPAAERVIFTVGSDKMYINEKENYD